MRRGPFIGRTVFILGASLLLAPGPAGAAVTPYVYNYILRHYDASNAVTASQMFNVPMPMARGEPGNWKLTVSPAYDQVTATPIRLRGASLNFGYSRRFAGGWGLYAIALTNHMVTSPTTEDGTPHDRLMDADFTGLTGPAVYAGTLKGGGAITTLGESFGPSYTFWRDRQDRPPVTLFGGPVFSQSFARNLRNEYDFTGTESGTGKSYRLHGSVDRNLAVTWMGAVLGAVAEYKLGEHFILSPHIYEVFLPRSRQVGNSTLREVETLDGIVQTDSTTHFSVNSSIDTVYFPIPGVDVVYRDWSLGINLVSPFGGAIARTTARQFLHGAWPMSLSLSKSFGNYQK